MKARNVSKVSLKMSAKKTRGCPVLALTAARSRNAVPKAWWPRRQFPIMPGKRRYRKLGRFAQKAPSYRQAVDRSTQPLDATFGWIWMPPLRCGPARCLPA
jgi:hypothetical protein